MRTATAIPVPPIGQFSLETWFERDRARVALQHTDTSVTVVEWLDDAVGEAIEDGFLDGKAFIMGRLRDKERLKRSAYACAQGMTAFQKRTAVSHPAGEAPRQVHSQRIRRLDAIPR
jgi:hypothetical protein